MSRTKQLFLMFVAGFSANASLHMWMQDRMGLEAYIVFMREGWVETSPWLGFVLLVLNFAFALFIWRKA